MKKPYIILATALMAASAGVTADMKPASIDFSIGLEATKTSLKAKCETLEERKIVPAQLPDTKESQVQLDCTGFDFEGASRLAEFVFRDGQLALVWVLTTPEEEPELEDKLTSHYGAPTYQGKSFTAFTGHHAALRKDVKEVLFYSPDLAPMFEAWFAQSAAEGR